MAISGSCSYTDPADYRIGLGEAEALAASGPRPFRARLTFIDLPSLRLLRAEEGGACVAFMALAPDRAFITFPIHRQPPLFYNGLPLRRGEVLLHAAEERFHQRTISLTRWGRVSLTSATLTAFSQALAGKPLAPPPRTVSLRPATADLTRLLRLHARAARIAEHDLDRLGHPQIARALDQDLIAALIACLAGGTERAPPAYEAEQGAVVDRFEALLQADRSNTIPIAEMCERIGVSPQTLDACCRDYLGTTP